MREKRKKEHIDNFFKTKRGPLKNGFDDIYFVHNALSNLNYSEINLEKELFGKKINYPILINAITGGSFESEKINKKLAKLAAKANIALAVGSQKAGLEKEKLLTTYSVVRKENPKGLIIGNLSALSSAEDARRAIDMVGADALQLHLNIAQEIAMPEGDRDFSRILENIFNIKDNIEIPLIIKEVGFGLSRENIETLLNLGIKNFDIAGAGGTNFVEIENLRNPGHKNNDLLSWGIPTAISLIETLEWSKNINSICTSGGICRPIEVAKALALGSDYVGLAGLFLRKHHESTEKEFYEYFARFFKDIEDIFFLLGVKNLNEIKKSPLVITGFVREWLEARDINIKKYANKRL